MRFSENCENSPKRHPPINSRKCSFSLYQKLCIRRLLGFERGMDNLNSGFSLVKPDGHRMDTISLPLSPTPSRCFKVGDFGKTHPHQYLHQKTLPGMMTYPPVNKHSNGKSPSWIGTTSSNGGFSIAMLDYRSVKVMSSHPQAWFMFQGTIVFEFLDVTKTLHWNTQHIAFVPARSWDQMSEN